MIQIVVILACVCNSRPPPCDGRALSGFVLSKGETMDVDRIGSALLYICVCDLFMFLWRYEDRSTFTLTTSPPLVVFY